VRGGEIDHIARIAEAWDGGGRNPFTPPTEHQLILRAARLPEGLWQVPWRDLRQEHRMAIAWTLFCFHRLREPCGWIFGEGDGPVER
jgi:hypothetical protein